VVNGLKEQAGRVSRGGADVINYRGHGMCVSRERPPQKFHVRGMKLAARSLSNEIRNFRAKTLQSRMLVQQARTGTDSDARGVELDTLPKKLSPLKKIGNFITTMAFCHSSNFARSLSPEGMDHMIGNDEFLNVSPLVSRCYEQCKKDGDLAVASSLHKFNLQLMPNVLAQRSESELCSSAGVTQNLCRCDATLSDLVKDNGGSFLGCWEHHGIGKDDLESFLAENELYLKKPGKIQQIDCGTLNKNETENQWKEFLKNSHCTVYRKALPNKLWEYRVHASFEDITARELLRTNTDTDYRKVWDTYIVDLNVVDSDPNPATTTELIHWITRCPYPFSTREYIYLRRHITDEVSKAMILLQKVSDKTDIPPDPKVMRVDTYLSKAIIKPHTGSFDEKGCDYLLTYYDDPKMMLPSRVMDLAASRGISESTKRMHTASLGLRKYNNNGNDEDMRKS